jgi:cellulose synthase (UDP-forming)
VTTAREDADLNSDLDHWMRTLSEGRVIAADSSGPVFSPRRPAHRAPEPKTFVPALSRKLRTAAGVITVGWALTYAVFWIWWFLPEHRTGWWSFAVNTAMLAFVTTLPAYFLITVNRVRRVSRDIDIPRLRVAMVVTKTPSEPWSLVRTTLTGMLSQEFPYSYDVWLCDENPTTETRKWCSDNGVRVSTRFGIEAYQRTEWPRRRRCKEGNLAYFYDTYGYQNYDVVSQLDADHLPGANYLAEMVRPFADPAIGYVAAPSVCDKNRASSWTVRGRLYHEAVFHGAHQSGHNGDLAPISIGSHYTVRTEALASIGGLGPELAEDFSTSYLMYVGGWSGAFAIDAHANGDGPHDFSAMVKQEFQWSRSLFLILFTLVPRTLSAVPWRMRLRFATTLSYYPLSVGTFVGGLALLSLAAVFGIQWVSVNYLEFVGFSTVFILWLLLLKVLLRRQGLLRPNYAPLISWEEMLYVLTKWPYNAWGLFAALVQWCVPRPLDFKVTPKGVDSNTPLPLRVMLPYFAIVLILSGSALVGMTQHGLVGYTGLCLLSATAFGIVSVIVPVLHGYHAIGESAASVGTFLRLVRHTLPVCILVLIPLALALYDYPGYFIEEVFP